MPQPSQHTHNINPSSATPGFDAGAVLYYFAVVIAGGLLLWHAFLHLDTHLWLNIVVWAAFCMLAEMKPVQMSHSESITVSFALHLSALYIWGLPVAVITAALGSGLSDVVLRRGFHKVIFNIGQYAITIWLSGQVYLILVKSPGILNLEHDLLALLLSCMTYVVSNSLLVAIMISLHEKLRLRDIWFSDPKFETLHYAALTPLAILTALIYKQDPYYIVLLAIPLVITHISFNDYASLTRQARETIELLADAMDRRDPYTARHSFRVAQLSTAIAREMGLNQRQIEEIEMGGKVHDLGKIAIPDEILNKPGALSPEEFKRVKHHPREGYDLLSRLRFYKSGLRYVLHHHERSDGQGYPDGLQGEEIPLGARIIAVADAFDAMTSNRPYRKAMTRQEAISELLRNSGKQFDPKVVEVAVSILTRSTEEQLRCS